jgi:hypothetical protein
MKLNYTKIFLIILVLCISFQQGYSGPRKNLGEMAAPELLIPLGSIGTALQGSNLASISGVDAMYWNPAGVAQFNTKSTDIMFSYMNYVADMSMQYIAGVAKIGNLGVIGASVRNLDFGSAIMVTDETNPEGTGATYKPVYLIADLCYAKAMTDKVRFGTNIKLISERIAEVSATDYAFDFGLQYIAGASGLSFGIALKNLGPQLTFDGPGLNRTYTENGNITYRRVTLQAFDLPTTLEIGVGYTRTFGKNNTVSIVSTFMNSSFTSDEYRFGLEYNYNKYVFLRGAFTYFPDKTSGEALFGPSFGAGVQYPFGGLTMGIDYAYRLVNESGFNSTNQFFTLHVGF